MSVLEQLDQQATLALNGSHSLFWDNVMLFMTETHAWVLVFASLLVVILRNNSLRGALIILVAMALLLALTDALCSGWVKPTVARWRPTQDPFLMYEMDVVAGRRGGNYGFFSGHACNTFSQALFLALLLRHTPATITVYVWAALHTFTRLYLGVHYVGDVLVGAAVGSVLGLLMYALYERVRRRWGDPPLVSGQFTAAGYLRTDLSAFVAASLLNYFIVLIVAMGMGI